MILCYYKKQEARAVYFQGGGSESFCIFKVEEGLCIESWRAQTLNLITHSPTLLLQNKIQYFMKKDGKIHS